MAVLDRGVTIYEMFQTIGRASLANNDGHPEQVFTRLQALKPEDLIEEYHRAVAILLSRGLLSKRERMELADYARDWIANAPQSAEMR